MDDITLIMMTPNKVPKRWAEFHRFILNQEVGDLPIITISNEPMDWGTNLIQTEYSLTNIYKQMLRAGRIAKTPYIGIVDDDTIYPREHFRYRPEMTNFAYNHNRWHIFSWKHTRPFFFHKPRPGNGLMIAPRELMVNAIEARLEARPELTGFLAMELGIKHQTRKYDQAGYETFYTHPPVVSFYHPHSIDPLNQKRRKVPWPVQAYELPKWGRADKVLRRFK